MGDRALSPLLDGGSFFESPRWHEGRWWVSDFYREAVYTVTVDGSEERILEVEHQPSGLGWLPDGSLLVVSMKDQRVLRLDLDGRLSVHADLRAFTDSSLNDMVVDGPGRAWVGCFACALGGDDGRTLLLCCAPDFLETNRRPARDAVLLTTTVEVPHAGLP